jgi:SOS-response transcriptional repressor LexA
MKIRIIAVGKLKNSPLLDLCEEYIKRMSWKVSVKEIDGGKGATSAQEAPLILKHLKEGDFLVALDERGETFSSPDSRQRDHLPDRRRRRADRRDTEKCKISALLRQTNVATYAGSRYADGADIPCPADYCGASVS